MKYCGNCGKQANDDARFCPACGKAFRFPPEASGNADKGTQRFRSMKSGGKNRVVALAALPLLLVALAVGYFVNGRQEDVPIETQHFDEATEETVSFYKDGPPRIADCTLLAKSVVEAFQAGDIIALEGLSVTAADGFSLDDYSLGIFALQNAFSLWLEDGYDLSYRIDRIYPLPDANWQAFLDWQTADYLDLDFSMVEQINVADVTFTGTQGDKTVCIPRKVWMALESGEWKLLYIASILDWNGTMLAADGQPEEKTVSQDPLTPEAAMAYFPVAKALEEECLQYGERGEFWRYAFLEDFDQDGELELLVGEDNVMSYVCSLYDYECGVMNVRFNEAVLSTMAGGGYAHVGAAYHHGTAIMTSYDRDEYEYGFCSAYRIYGGENYALTQVLQVDGLSKPHKYYIDGQQVSEDNYRTALSQYEGMAEEKYLLAPTDLVEILQRACGAG